jgi:hypothetical protein
MPSLLLAQAFPAVNPLLGLNGSQAPGLSKCDAATLAEVVVEGPPDVGAANTLSEAQQ